MAARPKPSLVALPSRFRDFYGRRSRLRIMFPLLVPFWARAGAVVAVLGTIAGADYLRHRDRAALWREYSFWALCGAAGALFAILNDLVTSRLSRDYFVIGKGLCRVEPCA